MELIPFAVAGSHHCFVPEAQSQLPTGREDNGIPGTGFNCNFLSWKHHLLIQQIFTEDLLRVKHYSRHWEWSINKT